MDTKRCAFCHKLVRADAQTCSRCGRVFVSQKTKGTSRTGTQRSIPPASPHRAGHYSGLHPEDQPYQSSMIAIQRPPVQEEEETQRHSYQEPEQIILPSVSNDPLLPVPSSDLETVVSSARRLPAGPKPAPITPPPQHRNIPTLRSRKRRVIPVLLALSCIFFLLASSVLALVLLHQRKAIATPVLTATPAALRVNDTFLLAGKGFGVNNEISFTCDVQKAVTTESGQPLKAHTDGQGNFAVSIRVPASWDVGQHFIHATDNPENLSVSAAITVQQPPAAPPLLQLTKSTLDLGDGRAGTTASASFTLSNKGGGQVSWEATSDDSWLAVTPTKGTFNGSTLVSITGNRSGLTAHLYTGQIIFVQKNGSVSLPLEVTMKVNPQPAALNISTSALTFSSIAAQAIPAQSITLQNSGGETLHWGSTLNTSDGTNWLSLSPASGSIEAKSSQVITVGVLASLMSAGQYQGTISFNGGANAQVNVTLDIVDPANLVVSTSTLTFSAIAGQNPASQTITLQNTGGVSLDWTASGTTTDKGSWLNASITSGMLDPGTSVPVSIAVSAATLKAGSYQGTLNFSSGTATQHIAITFTVAAPPLPAIGTQSTPLTFTTYKGTNPQPQSFTLTNSGNAILNWVATEDTAYAPVSPASGSLQPGQKATLTVSPSIASASAGTFTTIITIADSDTGINVASQKMAVTITVLDQPVMTLSDHAFSLTGSTAYPQMSSLLTIKNTGTQNLNWVLTPDSTAPWLTFDTMRGTVTPGSYAVVSVQGDSTQLTPGTYTATFTVSDSDSNTPVQAQKAQVTFVVS